MARRASSSLILDNEDRAAETRAELAQGPRRRGRPGAEQVRMLFGHPPAHEAADAWPRHRVEAWARDSSRWLVGFVREASGGKAVVIRADLHVDETRPHVHASILPAMPNTADGLGVTLSWERLHKRGTPSGPHSPLGARHRRRRGEQRPTAPYVERASPGRTLGRRFAVRLNSYRYRATAPRSAVAPAA